MGFEVTIYAFAALPLHFNPVVWNEDNGYATYQAIRSAAPLICDLDRRFDWLNWSLKRFEPAPLTGWAIGGREQITPDARSPQGFPICWNAQSICRDISSFLDGVDEARLQSVINYDEMAAAHLYKVENADRDLLTSVVMEDFRMLRAFYAATVRMGLGALIYRD